MNYITPQPIEKRNNLILQDRVYFLGGMPLIFWMNGPNRMGLKICPPNIDLHNCYHALMFEKYRWKSAKKLRDFKLYSHLYDEYSFWKNDPENPRSIYLRHWDQGRPAPRTYYRSEHWIQRHQGSNIPICPELDGYNDPYVKYIQSSEDLIT